MTDSLNAHQGPRPNMDRIGIPATRTAIAQIDDRATRLKRLVLVGALASFLGLFGLTIVVDHQAQQTQLIAQSTGATSASISGPNNTGVSVASHSHVRTRTS